MRACSSAPHNLPIGAPPYSLMFVSEKIGEMAPIDPSRLRLRNPSPLSTGSSRQQLRSMSRGRKFLRGPIPLDWLSAAARLPGRTLHAGVAIWLEAGFRDSPVVPLSNVAGHQFGLDRNSKYRALSWLEQAGLITVERKPGRSPLITIQGLPPTDNGDRADLLIGILGELVGRFPQTILLGEIVVSTITWGFPHDLD